VKKVECGEFSMDFMVIILRVTILLSLLLFFYVAQIVAP
jgi:hypothetical protein